MEKTDQAKTGGNSSPKEEQVVSVDAPSVGGEANNPPPAKNSNATDADAAAAADPKITSPPPSENTPQATAPSASTPTPQPQPSEKVKEDSATPAKEVSSETKLTTTATIEDAKHKNSETSKTTPASAPATNNNTPTPGDTPSTQTTTSTKETAPKNTTPTSTKVEKEIPVTEKEPVKTGDTSAGADNKQVPAVQEKKESPVVNPATKHVTDSKEASKTPTENQATTTGTVSEAKPETAETVTPQQQQQQQQQPPKESPSSLDKSSGANDQRKTQDKEIMDVEMTDASPEKPQSTDTKDKQENPQQKVPDVEIKDAGVAEPVVKNQSNKLTSANSASNDSKPNEQSKETVPGSINKPEEDNPKDDFVDVFSKLASKKQFIKGPKSKKKKLKISIQGVPASSEKSKETQQDSSPVDPTKDLLSRDWWGDDTVDETWLDYYAETHDEQDPSLMEREQERKKQELNTQVQLIDEKDIRIRKEIDAVVGDLLKEKQATMERGIEQYRERIRLESKKLLSRLEQRYHERVASNNAKINAKVKQLQQQQQNEMGQVLNSHRQQVQQRRIPEPMAANEWQNISRQLQAKHQSQHQHLTKSTDEYKRRTETDYKNEQDKIKDMHDKKMTDVNTKRSSILNELRKQFAATRQRYLKRHLQRIMKEKEEVKRRFEEEDKQEENETADFGFHVPRHATGINKNAQTQQQQQLTSPRDLAKSAVEHKQELRPPSPIRSIPEWYLDEHKDETSKQQSVLGLTQAGGDHHHYPETSVGASTRYKHRKGVLSQHSQHSQLSIEIHNEGLWIICQPNKSKSSQAADASGKKEDSAQPEFLEWSFRANEFLESVVNGEIPLGFMNHGRQLQFVDDSFMSQTSGQVFCSITDLRTSDETAHQQRAAALKEQEAASMAELEQKAGEYARQVLEHEKIFHREEKEEKQFASRVESTAADVAKAKRLSAEFFKRYAKYFGPDGRPLPSLSDKDRRDVENKIMRYDNNVKAAMEKDKAMRERHVEAKTKVQKLHIAFKTAQRNATLAAALVKKRKTILTAANKKATGKGVDRPVPRVKDVVGSLERLADKRREAHNTKKSGHITSTWLQTHPKLPDTLKKSVWRRMHRRKLQVVLRPSMDYLCHEIRERAAKVAADSDEGLGKSAEKKREFAEEKMLKAEQLFLLCCHPEANPSAASVPTSRSTEAWAEPGWQLDLSVPKSQPDKSNILPRAEKFPVLEKNLSEICSVPGRQAASFLNPSHFRPLASPLSTFAIMSSPAEIPSVLERMPNPKDQEGDPLHMTDAALKAAYTYIPKPVAATTRTTAQSRRKSTKDDGDTASTSSKPAPASRASSSATAETKKRRASKAEGSPRKRTKKQETAASSAAKAAEQAKSASTKATTPKTATTTSKASQAKIAQTKAASTTTAQTSTAHLARAKAPTASPQQQTRKQPQHQQQPQTQSRVKQPTQIQTQQPLHPPNQPNYASPHQQQQMAQLRMMQQQARPGQVPPGQPAYQPPPPGTMPQMQQFYNPLSHPNNPSQRGGQFRPGMGPAMGRMQPGAGRGVAMPMHQAMPMPGPGMPARPMQPGAPMAARVAQPRPMQNMAKQAQPQPAPAPQAAQQQQQQQQQKDQNDPLFMLNK